MVTGCIPEALAMAIRIRYAVEAAWRRRSRAASHDAHRDLEDEPEREQGREQEPVVVLRPNLHVELGPG